MTENAAPAVPSPLRLNAALAELDGGLNYFKERAVNLAMDNVELEPLRQQVAALEQMVRDLTEQKAALEAKLAAPAETKGGQP